MSKKTSRSLTSKSCLSCKQPFTYHRSSLGLYCSNQCQHDHDWMLRKKEIRSTGAFASTREARRYLKEKHGHKCKICKGTTWRKQPIPLVLDHIDGNSENYAVKNFRLICPNCDAQTPTYKGRNLGNGRHARRMRYAEGLSY